MMIYCCSVFVFCFMRDRTLIWDMHVSEDVSSWKNTVGKALKL